MKLLIALNQTDIINESTSLIASGDDAEALKLVGWKLCRERGIADAVWIRSSESWQELQWISKDGKATIEFVIRP